MEDCQGWTPVMYADFGGRKASFVFTTGVSGYLSLYLRKLFGVAIREKLLTETIWHSSNDTFYTAVTILSKTIVELQQRENPGPVCIFESACFNYILVCTAWVGKYHPLLSLFMLAQVELYPRK